METLTRNLTYGNPGVEVRAAGAILEHAYRGLELLDMAERLEIVEAKLELEKVKP